MVCSRRRWYVLGGGGDGDWDGGGYWGGGRGDGVWWRWRLKRPTEAHNTLTQSRPGKNKWEILMEIYAVKKDKRILGELT